MTHQHQWVFALEGIIPTSTNEMGFHRLEYCVVCGAFRIDFQGTWRYWYSDVTKKFLDGFDHEAHQTAEPPPGSNIRAQRSRLALARGLNDMPRLNNGYLLRLLKS